MRKRRPKPKGKTIVGVIRVHPRGFGFVEREEEDLFIPRGAIRGAVDGDTVEAEVTGPGRARKGPEGRVVQIIERGRSHLAGTIFQVDPLQMYAPILGPDSPVEVESTEQLSLGDRIIIHVDVWGNRTDLTRGHVTQVLGNIADPSIDVAAACAEYELRTDFPKAAIDEAKKFGQEVTIRDLKGRLDLRDLETVTIDPATAKDFDDAISLSKDKKGHYHLGVYIADVTHYMLRGGSLDRAAQQRSNSTYFPGTCVPMLPSNLSNHLCSLMPEVDRLAAAVRMEFDRHGKLVAYSVDRAVIRSDCRFSYEEAREVLDDKKKSPHGPLLKRMVKLCDLLKRHRRERGSIEFALPEAVISVDENGVPTGTHIVEYDITHQMIEEFMLKANETVARHLTEEGLGLTYRIHDMPTEDDLYAFYQLADAFGFKVPKDPTLEDLQILFDKAKATPYGAQLAVAFIRSMKLAAYSAENIGHYGLSLEHYCHFTSPIRRYADVVVHRVLFDEEYTDEEIEKIAHHCSEQERISSRAENDVLRLKKLRLLNTLREQDAKRQWEAVVASVKPAGITFEVVDLMLEGFIHISELGWDYYRFDEKRAQLVGRDSGQTFRCGEPVTVMLVDTDLIRREARWSIVK